MEKIKKAHNTGEPANFYFRRTYDQKEIDLIQEQGGKLTGFEAKWSSGLVKKPHDFLAAYPGSEFKLVNRENFQEYILK